MHVMTVGTRVRVPHCAGISRLLPRQGPRNSHRFDGLEVLVALIVRSRRHHLASVRADLCDGQVPAGELVERARTPADTVAAAVKTIAARTGAAGGSGAAPIIRSCRHDLAAVRANLCD